MKLISINYSINLALLNEINKLIFKLVDFYINYKTKSTLKEIILNELCSRSFNHSLIDLDRFPFAVDMIIVFFLYQTIARQPNLN